ncbi:MAG: DotD/TraH family lipoprotein [Rhodospirillales bacterium]|nr:DotD/TraH family lipoprotein [Rhodospirillales bacterium]
MRARRIPALLRGAALTSLVAGPLAGCTMWTPPPVPAAEDLARPDPIETRLVEAVERAERSLASLARAAPAPDSESGLPDARSVPAALRTRVSLDWTGPVEALAEELARRAGYRFAEAGRPPARPLIVAVEAEGEPLIAVLRDAGLRAGSAATLTVDAARRTVLLDWAAPPALAPEGDG